MYSDCDIKALTKMGIDVDTYLAASTGEQSLQLRRLRDTALATVHDNETRIAQIDYLRAKLNQQPGGTL